MFFVFYPISKIEFYGGTSYKIFRKMVFSLGRPCIFRVEIYSKSVSILYVVNPFGVYRAV